MGITAYHAKYFAYELTKRCSSSSLQKLTGTLLDAQVDLNPHQVEAALFAFNSPLSKGAILADEVGLGKTIEAGMVMSQKWAERKRKILLIVPSNLRKQWSQELQDKFFLPSKILEATSFNKEIKEGNLNPFQQSDIVICSYHFARNKDIYVKAIDWDLVVIDEAHRLRNVYKSQNKIAKAIKEAVSEAPKILLTATPLQNSLLELFGLVSIIDDHIFGDIKSFKAQFSRISDSQELILADLKERLKPICKRTLRRHVLEYIQYTKRKAITQEFIPNEDEEALYELLTEYLQRPKLYALPASQRHLMTLILRKLLASSTFAITGTLQGLGDKLERLLRENEKLSNSIKKRKESCFNDKLFDDFELYDELADEWGEEEEDNEEDILTDEDIENIKYEIDNLRTFEQLAKQIETNSKGECLLSALKKGFDEIKRLGGKHKAIIFTESTRTQKYLNELLHNSEFAGKIVLFNGSNSDPESNRIYKEWLVKNRDTDKISGSKTADRRAAIVDYFRNEAVIMIATEAAAEGINLQFCSLVVNYDLPWNPQRIEQRIGRCHRYGQKYDVVVVNFINKKNAADQRVYELLNEKFHLFNGVFGASDEILGAIESGVDFEKRISMIYQTCRTTEEIKESFDQLQKELDEQIRKEVKTTRQKLFESFDEEVTDKLKINLKESRNYLSKYEDWLWEITKYTLDGVAELDDDYYSFLLKKNPFEKVADIPLGRYKIGGSIEEAHLYRLGCSLAKNVIKSCKNKKLPVDKVIFDYSGTTKKISILESLIGKAGWLTVFNMTINSFEQEDHLLLTGTTDAGEELDYEQCYRLFSLSATQIPFNETTPSDIKKQLEELRFSQEQEIVQHNAEVNIGFFDSEMEKLEKWSDDIKTSLEIKLKQLDVEIKTLKTESKKILDLSKKVTAQREIKKLEKKRNEMRRNLFEAQDEVDTQKEELIEQVEEKMKQSIQKEELFTIRWEVV